MSAKPNYKSFRQFNKTPMPPIAHSRSSVTIPMVERVFNSDSLQDRYVRELALQKTLSVKEVLESFEFFARVRKHVRATCLTDLCCGHGLTGILFALFERVVERVVLIDHEQPRSHAKAIAAAVRVGPWVADKVEYRTARIKEVRRYLEPQSSVIAVHACGVLTDRCLDCAIEIAGAVALMPCCYLDRACRAPAALQSELGTRLAFDIDRTYRLEAAGYRVRWDAIPEEITPMNRVLIGTRRKET